MLVWRSTNTMQMKMYRRPKTTCRSKNQLLGSYGILKAKYPLRESKVARPYLETKKMNAFQFLVLICVVVVGSVSAAYSKAEAETALYLSGATFCNPEDYTTRSFDNSVPALEGFNATMSITDVKYATAGFVGYLPSAESIYVAYRGSMNWQNWMANLEARPVDYTSFQDNNNNGDISCNNCKVHRGFYTALLNDFDSVTAEVKRLKELYPSYSIKTTGHSLGAALSQLAAMELIARGFQVQSNYNFGQPRTGNGEYSALVNELLLGSTFRHVHYTDPVPHVPPPALGYVHACQEYYEPNEEWDGTLTSCGEVDPAVPAGESCEDPGHCMLQWKDRQLNPDDHMTYLGIPIKCY